VEGWKGGTVAVQCKQYPFVLFLQNAKLFAVEYAHLTHHCYLFILFSGQGSIRRSLVHKVTHHILSQDLEDAVNSDGDSDKYHQLISSLSSSRNWDHSLGSVLLIPQDLISQITMIVSSATLMWSKSPLLLATVAVAIFVKERIEKMAKRAEFKLQRLIGLDKHQWKGW